MKTDAYAINGITSTASLLNEWTELLNSFRNSLGLKMRGNPPPKWDSGEIGKNSSYYGIYGGKSSYAGFEIKPAGTIKCYYQEAFFGEVPDDRESFELEQGEPGTVWVTATHGYPKGSEDKAKEISVIFLDLQRSLREYAKRKRLMPHDPPNMDYQDDT